MRQLQPPHLVANFFRSNMQAVADLLRVCVQVAHLVAQQQRGERWIIVNNDASFAVEYLAARRKNRHLADAVLLGTHRVFIGLADLQVPQPVGKYQENNQRDVLNYGEFGLRKFFVAADHNCQAIHRPGDRSQSM